MVRREPAPEFDLNRFAERLERRDDALRTRVESLFDGLDARLGRIEKDVATGVLDREGLRLELGEVRRDLGEGREQASLLTDQLQEHIAASSAKAAGVAVTAAAGAAVGAASVMVTLRKLKVWQPVGALAAVFCAFAWTADKGPAAVRLLNAWGHSIAVLWTGIGR